MNSARAAMNSSALAVAPRFGRHNFPSCSIVTAALRVSVDVDMTDYAGSGLPEVLGIPIFRACATVGKWGDGALRHSPGLPVDGYD
jgi:hypothetical protein